LLIVEVVSPTDRWNEVRAKARGWIEHGAHLVWIVDPDERSVDVYVAGASAPLVLSAADTLTGDPVLPGFSVPVHALFP
jgi:Uma2 family endonuclease